MALLSYRRHRFPPSIIRHAIWLYLRFTLSYRDVEDLLAERGLGTHRSSGQTSRPCPRAQGLLPTDAEIRTIQR